MSWANPTAASRVAGAEIRDLGANLVLRPAELPGPVRLLAEFCQILLDQRRDRGAALRGLDAGPLIGLVVDRDRNVFHAITILGLMRYVKRQFC